jgi:hypothetical protein
MGGKGVALSSGYPAGCSILPQHKCLLLPPPVTFLTRLPLERSLCACRRWDSAFCT